MIDNYSDIIDIDYIPRKKMSLEMRSAQFAPFNALPSYAEKINEVKRLVEVKKDLTEDMKSIINNKINEIKQNIQNKPLITITYFSKDKYKKGGKYITQETYIKKIDEINKVIVLEENNKVLIKDIILIDYKI